MKKQKKEEKDEQLENYFEVFMRNYKNVPGFKILVKLGIYFLFIAGICILAAIGTNQKYEKESMRTTTNHNNEQLTYKDILLNASSSVKTKITIMDNTKTYIIELTNEDSEYIGYFETEEITKRFKIVQDKIIELKLTEEIDNPNLLGNININYIIPSKMISIIENNLATKQIEDDWTIYFYTINEENAIPIKVYIKDNEVKKILIEEDNLKYNIEYVKKV